MEKELRVIVIEDDDVACNCFVNCAIEMNTIAILECTNDSSKGLKLVEQYMPDAVILDLELNDGKGSGIEFLDGIKELDINYKPFVLVTTNNPSVTIHDFIRKAGADFIMSKQKKDYSEKEALKFLVTVKDSIQKSVKRDNVVFLESENARDREKQMKRRISSEMNNIGISPKMKGYTYLEEAIYLLLNNETENIYACIGRKYGKTNHSVERAMQNAIQKAWREADPEDLFKYYRAKIDPKRGAPTLTEFIYYYVKLIGGK